MSNGAAGATGPAPPAGGGAKGDADTKSGDLSLTSITLLVAPLIAALGLLTATGTIGRVQRDHPGLFALAIGLVLAAGVLWVLVSLTKKKESFWWWTPRVVAGLLALGGFALGLGLAIELVGDEPRPRISATLSEDRRSLDATVAASGLSTSHRLAIQVDGFKRSPEDREDFIGSDRLYAGYVGPDTDGNVAHTIKVPVPETGFTDVSIRATTGDGSYGCDDYPTQKVRLDKSFGSGTACVTIALVPLTQGKK